MYIPSDLKGCYWEAQVKQLRGKTNRMESVSGLHDIV